jgi:hypothetical protein
VAIIERAAAQSHRVNLQPARALLVPRIPDGNALAQETAGARAAPPAQVHPQRGQQPIEGARAGREQARPQIRIQPAMIRLISRQPFGQERHPARAARLEGGKPDWLEHGQEFLWIVLTRVAQPRRGRAGRPRPGAQRANGRLAMIAQQGLGLIEQLPFVLQPGFGVLPAQLGQHFVFGFLAHIVVHVGSHRLLAQRPVHTNPSTRPG